MKQLKGGATAEGETHCPIGLYCSYYEPHFGIVMGTCDHSNDKCVCTAGTSSAVSPDC